MFRSNRWIYRWLPVFLLVLFDLGMPAAPAAWACPVCNAGTGKAVRARLFAPGSGANLIALLLPFPIFLGIAALTYYGPPNGGQARRTTTSLLMDRSEGQTAAEERSNEQ